MFVCFSARTLSQQTPDKSDTLLPYFQFDNPLPLACLFVYFPPFFIQYGMELKSFIRSDAYRRIRQRFGDGRAVDALYIRAMQMTNNNTAISLLLSTVASLDHRIVGIKIPMFQLFFPLSNESSEDFNKRVQNLPSRLYSDSPSDSRGDRDKLQHFFGSALLTYVFESRGSALRVGEFIERGEDAFIIDGILDDRDRRANFQGQEFGLALLENNRRLPSEFLISQIASKKLSVVSESACSGVW
ncbi:MAG: hypothetical protein HY707_13655 [Ignavibacteriae bacterium]|nr:hypothetical protein [Ignavibacteriota bacterium]